MEDYNKVLEATQVSENASGTAAEKMTIYNDSLTAAQNRLTAAIQEFAENSNVSQLMITGIDLLTKIIQLLDLLLNKIPLISPLLRTVGTAFIVAFGTNAVSSIISTSTHISQLIKLIKGAASATTIFGGVSMPVFLGIAAAIGVAVGAGKLFYDLWKDNTPEAKLEQANEKLQESQEKLDETNEKIAEIQGKIKDIDDKGTLSLADEQEKKKLQDQLDLLKDIKKTQKEINEVNQKKTNDATYNDVKSRWDGQTSTDFDKATSDLKDRQEQYGVEANDVGTSDAAGLVANIRSLTEAEKQLTEETQNYIASASDEDKQTVQYQNTLGMYQSELDKYTNGIDENTKALKEKKVALDEDIIAMQNAGKTNTEEYQNLVNLRDAIQLELDPSNWATTKLADLLDTSGMTEKVQDAVKESGGKATEEVQDQARDMAKKIMADDTLNESFAKAFNIDVNKMNLSTVMRQIIVMFQQMFGEIKQAGEDSQYGFSSLSDVQEAYQAELQNIHDKTVTLTAAYQDMNKQGYISETNAKKLLAEYPQLANKIQLVNGKYVVTTQTLKELNNAVVNESITNIKSQKEQTIATIEQVRTRIKAYKSEAAALSQKENDPSAKARLIGVEHSIDIAGMQLDKLLASVDDADSKIAKLEKYRQNWNPKSNSGSSHSGGSKKTPQKKALEAAKDAYNLDKTALDTKKEELEVVKSNLEATKEIYETEKDRLENDKDIVEQHKKLLEQELDEVKDAQESMADLIDLTEKKLKQQYENEKTRLNSIKDYIGEIQDAVDGVKDNYEDVLDKTKEKLKLDKKAEENQKKITDKAKEIADIQRQLAELEFDDSASAQTQKAELLSKLNDAQDDLEEEQKSQAYDQAEQAVDDAKEKLNSVFDQIDAAIDGVENVIDKYINYVSDILMEDGNLAVQALQQVNDMVSGANPKLLQELYDFNNKYGDHLESTVTKAFTDSLDAVQKYAGETDGTFTGTYQYLGNKNNEVSADIKVDEQVIQSIETDIYNTEQKINDVEATISGVEAKISNVELELKQLEISYKKQQLDIQGKSYDSDPDLQKLITEADQLQQAAKENTQATSDNTKKTAEEIIAERSNTTATNTNTGATTTNTQSENAGTQSETANTTALTENTTAVGQNTVAQAAGGAGTGTASFGNIGSFIDFSTGKINWANIGSSLLSFGLQSIQSPSFWTGAIDLVSSLLSGTLFSAHEGTNYVSKANSWLDDMLGLGENETARVLEVGEQVIPKGEEVNLTQFDTPFNRDFVTGHPTISNSGNSGDINIDMGDITASGIDVDALESFLNKKKSEIADYVYSNINKQVKIAGHRNVRGKW